MRLTICAVGKLRKGPEKDLVDDYLSRATKAGRNLGLPTISQTEVDDRKGGGMIAEAALLRRAIPSGAMQCALDERGQQMSSTDFAALLADARDRGNGDVAFVIGGADGIDPALREEADVLISLGRMVWPHMLVRVMVAEQIYRATQILAGTPYHRV